MNLVTITVVEVLGEPIKTFLVDRYYWHVPVKVDSWGSVWNTNLTCYSEEDAKAVKVGYSWEG